MANSHSDRNLLIGVLALQFGLVTREQLIAGISAWGTDTSQPLDDVFHTLKFITDDGKQKLRTLFEMHLKMHGVDVEKSLAAFSSISDVRQDLEQAEISGLTRSLKHLSSAKALNHDQLAATTVQTIPARDTAFASSARMRRAG